MTSSFLRSAASVTAFAIAICFSTPTRAQVRRFDVPAQSASGGVREFATQAGIQITLAGRDGEGRTTNAIRGVINVREALQQLLAGTGLTVRSFDGRVAILTADRERAEAEDKADGEDDILVTGYREANSAAIADKRKSLQITDGINSDTVGLLPDQTVADIAARIPGVTSIATDGALAGRSLETSESVVIRGLAPNYNLTTVDGVPIATSSENNRSAKLSLFPPTTIARVEAIKTLTADLDPHGLSGQLNLITISALNRGNTFGNIRFSMGESSMAGKLTKDQGRNIRASGLYGLTFGASDQFGVVVSASYEKFFDTSRAERPGGQDGTYMFYLPNTTAATSTAFFENSNGYAAPIRNQIFLFENEQERVSATVKLEWQPSDATTASLFGALYYQNEKEMRYEHLAVGNGRPANQTAMTGNWTTGLVVFGAVDQPEKTKTALVTGKLEHDLGERSSINLTGSFSRATYDALANMSNFQVGYTPSLAFSYDQSSGNPLVSFQNPGFANNLANMTNNYIRERTYAAVENLYYASASYDHGFDRGDTGLGYRLGGSFLQRNRRFDYTAYQSRVADPDNCTRTGTAACSVVTFDHFVLDKSFSTTDPNVPFYIVDDAKLRALWESQGRPMTSDQTGASVGPDYTLRERIWSLYAQGRYRTDAFDFHVGLRYDSTRDDVDLFLLDQSRPASPAAGQYVPTRRAYDYDFFLPSAIATWRADDNWVVRAAYTRTLARPNIEYLKRGETFGPASAIVARRDETPKVARWSEAK